MMSRLFALVDTVPIPSAPTFLDIPHYFNPLIDVSDLESCVLLCHVAVVYEEEPVLAKLVYFCGVKILAIAV
jgi:hypothetical protein